ncbi:hypothetical protein MJH12_08840 [bacterium]|nr:hypothetical protein [bacterium]
MKFLKINERNERHILVNLSNVIEVAPVGEQTEFVFVNGSRVRSSSSYDEIVKRLEDSSVDVF